MFYRSGSLAAVTVGAMRNTSLAPAPNTSATRCLGRTPVIKPKTFLEAINMNLRYALYSFYYLHNECNLPYLWLQFWSFCQLFVLKKWFALQADCWAELVCKFKLCYLLNLLKLTLKRLIFVKSIFIYIFRYIVEKILIHIIHSLNYWNSGSFWIEFAVRKPCCMRNLRSAIPIFYLLEYFRQVRSKLHVLHISVRVPLQ